MNIEAINLFPVAVLRFSNFLNENQCKNIIEKYENYDKFKQHDYFTNDGKTSHDIYDNIHDKISGNVHGCEDFTNKINDALKQYSSLTGFCNTKITNSWINIQNKGSALYDHMHALSYVSGCIYLKLDDFSNNIFFWNPNQFVNYIVKNEETIYSSETYWIKPNIGDLLLFPGWIKHGSNGYENLSDNRISIAFNSMP